ncbi:MAG: DNA recombination protein RmuC, partial [Paracoccaceae bacterium]
MPADYVTQIQNDPALMALIAAILVIAVLLIWWRSGGLANARTEVETLEGQATEQRQIQSDMREEIARFTARQDQWQADQSELNAARAALSTQKADIARLTATLEHQRVTEGTLKEQFANLANEVMKSKSADFKKENAEQLKNVLEPLKQHIGHFEKELREVHKSADKDRAALKADILNLTAQSQQVSEEAHNLTQALKGDSQKQGAWGEMILASILDRSGLREGEEYITQAHHRDEDGKSLRPDVVVNLPGGRRLVVDSKVSLVAYERSVQADNETARAVDLKAHVDSVRTHIDTLSKKNYHQLDDASVDYVIMFMPVESAFSEAVRADSNLTLYATQKDVLIASPANLMLALKTVENLWSVENRNRNAMEIAKRAGRLYDKFRDFVADMEKIGVQLATVQKT